MKTFDEVKKDLSANFINGMTIANRDLQKENIKEFEISIKQMVIDEYQKNLDNIDEITAIEIGAETNNLIENIGKLYKLHIDEYWRDFKNFINNYVIGLTSDGKLKKGMYLGRNQCMRLGIGLEELMCFQGKDPLSDETIDMFRQIVNQNFGTNIPTANIERETIHNYEKTPFDADQITKDNALIALKEMQRDSGILKSGQLYYPLATDSAYQEAVARTTGKTL